MTGPEGESGPSVEDVRGRLQERASQMAGQSSVFLVASLASKVIVFLFTVFLARTLGAERLGLFALGLSATTLLAAASVYGLPEAALRYIPHFDVPDEAPLIRNFTARSMKVVAVIGGMAGLVLYLFREAVSTRVFDEPELAGYLPAFGAMVILLAMYRLLRHVLRGLQEAGREAGLHLVAQVGTRVGLSVVLVLLGFGLWGYVAGYAVGITVGAAAMLISVRRKIGGGPGWRGSRSLEEEVHDFSRLALGGSLLGVATRRGDRLLLGLFLPAADIGVYDVAMSAALSLPIVLYAANSVLGPVISELHDDGQMGLLGVLAERTNKWVTALTLPAAVCIAAYAPSLMSLFGDGFAGGWPLLVVLIGAQVVNVSMGSTGALASMSGHQKEHFWSMAITAGSVLILDVILIPLWGVIGAAVAFLLATVFQHLYLWWVVVHRVGANPLGPGFRSVLLPTFATAACVFAIRFATDGWVEPWWASAGAAVLGGYVAMFAGLRWKGWDDVDEVLLEGARVVARRTVGREHA